jgi:hypothetical protein
MTAIRRRVVKCERCFQRVVVEYPDDVPEHVIKEATRTEHRLRYPWCHDADKPKLLWVSDDPVKE